MGVRDKTSWFEYLLPGGQYMLRIEPHLVVAELVPLSVEVTGPLCLGLVVREVLLELDAFFGTEPEDSTVLISKVAKALGFFPVVQGRPQQCHEVEDILVRCHHRGPIIPSAAKTLQEYYL